MASPVLDNVEHNINTDSESTLNGVASATSTCNMKTSQRLCVDNRPGGLMSAGNPRISRTAVFMATELLEHLISGSSIRRTVSQDVQSFCWVIIYITFKYTAVELMAMSTSAIKEIVGFNNMNVRQEFHTLFSATSATDLVNQRKVAFRMKAGTVEHRGQALAYAGIENLYNYVKSKDVALARHLSMIWHLLKMCQPLQLTSGMDDEMEAEDMRFLRKVTGDAPVAEASSVRPSAFSITFNHADLIGVLEIGLERMGKQAAHAQST